MIIQLAISRQREYVADATGAEYVGDPNPLADALETLHRIAAGDPDADQPGCGAALHREPTPGRTRAAAEAPAFRSVLDRPADGGARRAPPPDGGRQQPAAPALLGSDGDQDEVRRLVNTDGTAQAADRVRGPPAPGRATSSRTCWRTRTW